MQLRRMDDIIPALRANIAAIAAEAAGVSANPTNPGNQLRSFCRIHNDANKINSYQTRSET